MTRPWRALVAIPLAAIWLAAVAGCSPGGGQLEGTRWKLSEWTVSSLDPADFTITAEFADGRVSGRSEINTYSGPYKAGSGGGLEVGEVAGTLMAGSEPAMRAESAYLALLRQARSFKVTDGKLTLYDEGGNQSLIFEPLDE